jgi:hypothetical protein
MLAAAPCLALAFFSPTPALALLFLVPSYGLGNIKSAPTFAMAQALVGPRARAMAAAVLMTFQFLIGNSLGPTVVGMISDALMPTLGDRSLGWALSITSLTNVWAFFHFLMASRYLRDDLKKAR